jgi:hypothetical protein
MFTQVFKVYYGKDKGNKVFPLRGYKPSAPGRVQALPAKTLHWAGLLNLGRCVVSLGRREEPPGPHAVMVGGRPLDKTCCIGHRRTSLQSPAEPF